MITTSGLWLVPGQQESQMHHDFRHSICLWIQGRIVCHLSTQDGRVIGGVLVSYCCCDGLPPTWRLKTTQIYHLTVLELRHVKWISLDPRLEPRCPRAAFLLEAPGENLFPCIFKLQEDARIPWFVAPFFFIFKVGSELSGLPLPLARAL